MPILFSFYPISEKEIRTFSTCPLTEGAVNWNMSYFSYLCAVFGENTVLSISGIICSNWSMTWSSLWARVEICGSETWLFTVFLPCSFGGPFQIPRLRNLLALLVCLSSTWWHFQPGRNIHSPASFYSLYRTGNICPQATSIFLGKGCICVLGRKQTNTLRLIIFCLDLLFFLKCSMFQKLIYIS